MKGGFNNVSVAGFEIGACASVWNGNIPRFCWYLWGSHHFKSVWMFQVEFSFRKQREPTLFTMESCSKTADSPKLFMAAPKEPLSMPLHQRIPCWLAIVVVVLRPGQSRPMAARTLLSSLLARRRLWVVVGEG